MQLFVPIVGGLMLVYFALRVVQMKRPAMPFVVAYPLFVLILVGGGVAIFIGMSWVAVLLRLPHEVALGAIYGVTAVSLFGLWWAARRAIG